MPRYVKQIIFAFSFVLFAFAAALSFSAPALAYTSGNVSADPQAGSPLYLNYTTSSDYVPAVLSSHSFTGTSSNVVSVTSYADIPLNFSFGWSSNAAFQFPISGYDTFDFTLDSSSYGSAGSPSNLTRFISLLDSTPVSVFDQNGGSITFSATQRTATQIRFIVYYNGFDYRALGVSSYLANINLTFRVKYSYQSTYKTDTETLTSSVTQGLLACSFSSSSSNFHNSSDFSLAEILKSALEQNNTDNASIIDSLLDIVAVGQVGFDGVIADLATSNSFWSRLLGMVENPSYYQNLSGHTFFEKVYTLLYRLQYILGGSDYDPNTDNATTLASKAYERWKQIIIDAMTSVTPTEAVTELDNANENLQNQMSSQEAIESQVFSEANSSIQQINWSVSPPTGIAGAAASLMALVGRFWDQLGILQFGATITLLAGIVIAIIGVVNRYNDSSELNSVKRKRNESRRNRKP